MTIVTIMDYVLTLFLQVLLLLFFLVLPPVIDEATEKTNQDEEKDTNSNSNVAVEDCISRGCQSLAKSLVIGSCRPTPVTSIAGATFYLSVWIPKLSSNVTTDGVDVVLVITGWLVHNSLVVDFTRLCYNDTTHRGPFKCNSFRILTDIISPSVDVRPAKKRNKRVMLKSRDKLRLLTIDNH